MKIQSENLEEGYKRARLYQLRKTDNDVTGLVEAWISTFRIWFRVEEHERRAKGTIISLPDDSASPSKARDPNCRHCGKPKSEHEGGVFDKCNEEAAKKAKKVNSVEEKDKKTPATPEPKKNINCSVKSWSL